ncbi:MAG: helix-turn-helix transcriptional regulator [Actinomycetota bacterium]|jgi:transcriptional regulator with XRE-family HTH domain|nr:helix-turn-helix transcriptional regulator [Rubrobacter sp.]MDQ3508817.1 helix-turn-helix transcriptional regulator [Actinomycetota bacterium]
MPKAKHEELAKWSNRSIPLPNLRSMRRSRGLSQRELGERASVSPGTVYRLENGLRGAYPQTMRKLASALGAPPEDLVREGLRRKISVE